MIEKIKELNLLKSDKERLLFCKKYKEDFIIVLDNDSTNIRIIIDYDNWSDDKIEEYENYYNDINNFSDSFDKDFGSRDGIPLLFEMLDIRCEFV